jgi:hypothetical protein
MSLSVPSKTSASPEHSTISTDTLHYNDARHGKAIALVAVLRNKKKGGEFKEVHVWSIGALTCIRQVCIISLRPHLLEA